MNVILYFEAMDVVAAIKETLFTSDSHRYHSLESSECLKCGMDGIWCLVFSENCMPS